MDGDAADLRALGDALGRTPGRPLFVVGAEADSLAERIADAWGVAVTRVGESAARIAVAGLDAIASSGSRPLVLTDADVLFWGPTLRLDVTAGLRRLARRPLAIVWPGVIEDGVARYSEFGRKDYYEVPVDGALLISARPDAYAGEPTFTLERVGA